MSGWEYKVVPAPKKGVKGAGVKGAEGRFANAVEALMNDMGTQGWEYQRAETLPSTERSGLTGSTTEWRNLLVFRRAVVDAIDDFEPELLPAPVTIPPTPMVSEAVVAAPSETPATPETVPAVQQDADESARNHADASAEPKTQSQSVAHASPDNGVEDTSDMGDMTTSLKNLAIQRSDAKSDS